MTMLTDIEAAARSADQQTPQAEPLISRDSSLLREVEVTLQARLGQRVLPLSELMELRSGTVLALETRISEPIELLLNGALVALGEIVAVDDRFGVRIVEIAAK